MDSKVRAKVDALYSEDREEQQRAFLDLLEAAERPVEWAYEVWDQLVTGLASPNNRVRAITAQLLCSLARKSDPDKRILKDFPRLMAVTRDTRFVTARHTLQNIWKVGAAGQEQALMLLKALSERYISCIDEKNYMLVRYDIIAALKRLYDEFRDERIRFLALKLIALEENPRNHQKNLSLWKNRK